MDAAETDPLCKLGAREGGANSALDKLKSVLGHVDVAKVVPSKADHSLRELVSRTNGEIWD